LTKAKQDSCSNDFGPDSIIWRLENRGKTIIWSAGFDAIKMGKHSGLAIPYKTASTPLQIRHLAVNTPLDHDC
jgi:hypothetical protein